MRRLLLTSIVVCCGLVAFAEETGEIPVVLRWALGALDTAGGEPTAINRDTELQTGARLKFLVEPLSPCSVYLILLDSSQQVHLLYHGEPTTRERDDRTYVPPGAQWFELDDAAGRETFFLLASAEPLTKLEGLLERQATTEAPALTALNEQIVEEIRELHRAHRDFSRPAEKPVMIGGQLRASGGPIDHLAVEISAERFYGKTITIDH
jgi:hypothetical protein